MVRTISGIAAGLLAMVVTVGAIELLAHLLFPVPSDSAPIPLGIQLLVLGAYFLGALIGGAVAERISGKRWTVWVIALLVVAGAIWSMFLIPHPQWMQIAAVIAPLAGGFVASHIARSRATPPAAA